MTPSTPQRPRDLTAPLRLTAGVYCLDLTQSLDDAETTAALLAQADALTVGQYRLLLERHGRN